MRCRGSIFLSISDGSVREPQNGDDLSVRTQEPQSTDTLWLEQKRQKLEPPHVLSEETEEVL